MSMQNINKVYDKIKEVLNERGAIVHLNNLQKITNQFAVASEIWGDILKYLKDLENNDPNVYRILRSYIEELRDVLANPYNDIRVPWVFKRKEAK